MSDEPVELAHMLDSELEAEDAKLSTEKRNKLKKGTFCGPGRSFPVPDCAHVTAARRLIGRAKVSDATKKKILSCVSRKASSLGCSTKSNDSSVEELVTRIVNGIDMASTHAAIQWLEDLYAEEQAEAAKKTKDSSHPSSLL